MNKIIVLGIEVSASFKVKNKWNFKRAFCKRVQPI